MNEIRFYVLLSYLIFHFKLYCFTFQFQANKIPLHLNIFDHYIHNTGYINLFSVRYYNFEKYVQLCVKACSMAL